MKMKYLETSTQIHVFCKYILNVRTFTSKTLPIKSDILSNVGPQYTDRLQFMLIFLTFKFIFDSMQRAIIVRHSFVVALLV